MSGKNFIWLIFDSIRGDRTSVGGYERETTPTLEAIGSRSDGHAGTCFAHAIWSQPSVASMLTGTYPSTHGSGSYNETLPEEIPTVAERLAEAGYRTIGVSSNPYFSSTTGTHRGFDTFDLVSGKELAQEAGLTGLLSFLKNIRKFSGGIELEKQKHTPDFLLNEMVKDRLQTHARRDGSFFLAAHYSGTHHPYYPSPHFRTKFASQLPMSPKQAAEETFGQTTDVYSRIARGGFDGEDVGEAIDAMYDAQVAQVDALIDTLVSYIDRLGIGDDTILVVTADHGDLLGEMDLFSHKLVLHDALIEVPIAVRGSEYIASSELGLAQHGDIMQTILSELGVDTAGMQGQRLDESPREMAVAQRGAETYQKTIDEVRKHEPGFENEHVFPGFVTALRTERWKYVLGEDDAALYMLPFEEENVAAEHPTVVEKFKKRFEEWIANYGERIITSNSAEFDEDVQSHLADLGYIVD